MNSTATALHTLLAAAGIANMFAPDVMSDDSVSFVLQTPDGSTVNIIVEADGSVHNLSLIHI